jgi:D-beta-D-heptose 7-phosphate kinase/D-beta-D-heptose 1-phosphate adenosyltransferase
VLNALGNIAAARLLVIGDVMLDIYVSGDVDRISAEAPVPVIRLVSERAAPGGAANVAANVAALGATVSLVGFAGMDQGFRQLRDLLAPCGRINLDGLLRAEGRPTTTKTRVVGQRQQIARIDREDVRPLSGWLEAEILRHAIAALGACDVVLLSDYGKGVLTDKVITEVLAAAREYGLPAMVDPKRRDWSAYRGATFVTPNRTELSLATAMPCGSDDEVVAAARAAQAVCGANILVTRSEKGMSFIPLEGASIHMTTVAREVFEVSGAGDTVVAVLGVMLAAGLPIVEAIRAANRAAGIVVGKFGTAVVTQQELASVMHQTADISDVTDGRLLTLDDLLFQRARWREQGMTVGLANGCFDLLHPGHVALVTQAAAACDRLVIAINTDSCVRKLKGLNRPVQSENARAAVMGAIKGVAAVVIFNEDTPYELIATLQPDVLVKGADYCEDQVVGAELVRAAGGTVLLVPLAEGQSTSRLIACEKAVANPTSP